jgi:hypothetical protein
MEQPIMQLRTAIVTLAAVLGFGAGCGGTDERTGLDAATAHQAPHPAFLYGRVTLVNGETYRGRLRFGGDEEAFWGEYFYGRKDENPWIAYLPRQDRPREGIRLVGLRIGADAAAIERPFMARMGDIAKLEANGRHLWVTMKNGTVHHLDRYAADDFADGVRVWDATHGVTDLNERRIRTIEFESPPGADAEVPFRLHGTVRTPQGEFTGFIEWGRKGSLAMDELHGTAADGGQVSVPFVTVRSISRLSGESARVTLLDGRALQLSGSRHIGSGNRGIFVDDARYGRVLVSWAALERADFTPVGAAGSASGPSYGDFPPGQPLAGTVTARDGRRLSGSLVFDLDESETTATLDAPAGGVDYTLPFDLVRSIELPGGGAGSGRAAVFLHSGERLELERAGDLGPNNGGLLVFAAGSNRAEFVPWRDVVRVEFEAAAVR